jgi:hypothetical protein
MARRNLAVTISVSLVVTCSNASPVDVSYTKTEISARQPDEIRSDAKRLAAFPDHPDARRARHHLEMLERPYAIPCRLVYASRDQMYHEITQVDGSQVSVAASGSRRWMMTAPPDRQGATVTVIEAGKPAPIMFDVSRMFHMQEITADLLFRFGVPEDAEALANTEVSAGSHELRVHRCDRNGFEYRTTIRPPSATGAVQSVVTEISTAADGVVHERMNLEGYREIAGIPERLPTSVRIEYPLGRRELHYDFVSVQPITEAAVKAYAGVPSASELEQAGGQLFDATSSEMIESQLASGVGRVTWRKNGSSHSYEYGDPVGEKVQFASGPPSEGDERSKIRIAGRWLAAGIGVFMAIGFVILRIRK